MGPKSEVVVAKSASVEVQEEQEPKSKNLEGKKSKKSETESENSVDDNSDRDTKSKTKSSKKYEYIHVLGALKAFKSIYGHINVPGKFEVPSDDSNYPKESWGLALGNTLHNIKAGRSYADHKAELEALGITFTLEKKARLHFDAIYAALIAYKNAIGNLDVQHNFVVPSALEFPEETWGLHLGQVLANIRVKGTYSEPECRQKLIDLGVRVERIKTYTKSGKYRVYTYAQIYNALQIFSAQHGNVKVPLRYVITEGDEVYPADVWGCKLGMISLLTSYTYCLLCCCILTILFILCCCSLSCLFFVGVTLQSIRRNGLHAEHQADFEALGVDYEVKRRTQKASFELIYTALKAYKEVYGDLKIKQMFVIPEGYPDFPEETWNMKLGKETTIVDYSLAVMLIFVLLCMCTGNITHTIRSNSAHAEHRDKLIELGFSYDVNLNR